MLKAISIIGYLGMVGGLLAGVKIQDFSRTPRLLVSVQIAAVMLLVWARVVFGRRSYHVVADPTAGGLVTTGPFRYVRHPIYAAMCLFTLAGFAADRTWGMGLCAGLVLISAFARIFCEENLVQERYPEYAQYSARTWRMLPYIY